MTKTIHIKEQARESFGILTEISGLQDLDVVAKEVDAENLLHLYCVSRWDVAVCPDCGEISQNLHDYPRQRRIHDAPLRGQKVLLIFDSVRFDCEACKKPFTQPVRDVVPDCTYTQRLYEEISDPKRKQDVATLAEIYGVGYKIVESILLKAGEAKLTARRVWCKNIS